MWEPTAGEMDSTAELFKKSDEDPTGAVVVTRTGVEATEVLQGGAIWKISDEWEYLSTGKMRALGINEAFLSGDSTYTSYENAKTIFVEQVRKLRELITEKTIMEKAEVLARIHNITESNMSSGVRINPSAQNVSLEKAMAIPKTDLILPEIRWQKTLSPEGDTAELELLTTLADLGFPVTLKALGSSAGFNTDNFIGDMEEDLELRRQVGVWNKLKEDYESGDFSLEPTIDYKALNEEMEEEGIEPDIEDELLEDEDIMVDEEAIEEPTDEGEEIEPASAPEKEVISEEEKVIPDSKILTSIVNTLPWVDDKLVTLTKDEFIRFLIHKEPVEESKKGYANYLIARLDLGKPKIKSETIEEIWMWLPPKQKQKEILHFNKLGLLNNNVSASFKTEVDTILSTLNSKNSIL